MKVTSDGRLLRKLLPLLGHSPLGEITEFRACAARWDFRKGLEHANRHTRVKDPGEREDSEP